MTARERTEHRPHFNDSPILQRMARIGFNIEEAFDLNAAQGVVGDALEKAAPEARDQITNHQQSLAVPRNGWILLTENMGAWGTNYLKRACVDLIGLGANLPEDAVYPVGYTDADGAPYSGEYAYVMHFDKDELPPVLAFWSLTMYDAEGFQVPNEIDRFAIGDRDDLQFDDDGSLDLLIQHGRPDGRESNWLPAPADDFNLCLRAYHPKPEVLDGSWTPPAVAKAAGVT